MKVYMVIAAVILTLVITAFALKKQNESLGLRLDLASKQVIELEELAQKRAVLTAERDRIDKKYAEEMTRAKSEIDDLRAAVDDGAKRLRVKASCPTVVSGATSTASLPNAAGAELDRAARSDYFSLRERVITTEKRLAGLQEYVRNVCLSGRGE
ncbi:lysis protein [Stutzerimonas stutzeri]|uniref:Lysis protein n=1 Tax=Stutzerimonas stutzeri TaxID=316 RepID=A0AA42H2N1_STUST|nr:lysis protein [Stutzerimonas stutzeri]MDH0145146.1 lysis protein [Stutzerimonas stutzeri]MDH0149599.1 lysis protein [Stutzerimonas stutzeri]